MQGFAAILQRILSDPNRARQLGLGSDLDIGNPDPNAPPPPDMPGAQDFSSPYLQTMDYRPERDDPALRKTLSQLHRPVGPPDVASGFDGTAKVPPVWDAQTARSFLDRLRNNPTPEVPGSAPGITPEYADPVTEIQDKPDPTDDYLAKLISEYRASGRDFGDLQGEADRMAREQGYSDNIPNATGFKGVLSKISRAAGGFLRGMAGEKNKDGSPVSLVSELSRYKHGIDDKEGFEAKRDDLLKREVLPRYASKRELDKERIGTLEGEVNLRDKQIKQKADIAYKQQREARLREMGADRTALLRERIDVDKTYKAAIVELRQAELEFKSELNEDKRATAQAYGAELGKWATEGQGLVAAAEEAEALYNEAKSPNSNAAPEQIAALRSRMAQTKEAMANWKTRKPAKGSVAAAKPSAVGGAARQIDPATRTAKLAALAERFKYLTPEQKPDAVKSLVRQAKAAGYDYTEAEIRKALGL